MLLSQDRQSAHELKLHSFKVVEFIDMKEKLRHQRHKPVRIRSSITLSATGRHDTKQSLNFKPYALHLLSAETFHPNFTVETLSTEFLPKTLEAFASKGS